MAANTYTVRRSMVIAAPPAEVYERIADFHSWSEWSPWDDLDPDMERTYSGASEGEGARYAWSGNRQAGTGRMEIVETEPPGRVLIDLVFEKPWKSHSITEFTIDRTDSGSEVTWTMTAPQTLMTRVMGIFKSMDSLLGPDFEKGLSTLKAKLEA